MGMFRLFLIAFLLILFAYTSVTVANHGLNLLPIFFGDMAKMEWPGQFNLDFFGFLLLSGIWTAWRNHFSAGGLALAVVAVLGGMAFLSVYLLYLISKTGGDIRVIMLGEQRARQA